MMQPGVLVTNWYRSPLYSNFYFAKRNDRAILVLFLRFNFILLYLHC